MVVIPIQQVGETASCRESASLQSIAPDAGIASGKDVEHREREALHGPRIVNDPSTQSPRDQRAREIEADVGNGPVVAASRGPK